MQVRMTQRAIKQVLTERYYSWEEARKIAREDSEVDLSGDGPAYVPRDFEDDVVEEIEHAGSATEPPSQQAPRSAATV